MSVHFTFAEPMADGVLCIGLAHDHGCPQPDTCEDFGVYGYCDHIADARGGCFCHRHDVDMANGNAREVLGLMGLVVDPDCLAGTMQADEFGPLVQRTLLDLRNRPSLALVDAGRETVETGGFRSAHMIDCGRRPGYLEDRLEQLAALAEAAVDHGVQIGWS